MFISPGWLPASVGYRVEGRPDHGLRSRFWRFAPTRLLNLGRARTMKHIVATALGVVALGVGVALLAGKDDIRKFHRMRSM
jgi:hypothetical protein